MASGTKPARAVAIVLNWNGREVLAAALSSLLAQQQPPVHIIVVDNASTDGSPECIFRDFPQVQLIRNSSNLGYAGGCNMGIAEAAKYQPDYVLLINNDVVVERDLLEQLIQEAERDPQIGILAPAVKRMDAPELLDSAYGRIRFHHVIVDRLGESEPAGRSFVQAMDVDCVFGAVLLVRYELFSKVGDFDADFWMFLEEVEFCFRARQAGFRIRYFPRTTAYHHGGHSTLKSGINELRTYLVRRNSVLFMKKHGTCMRWCRFLPAAAASLLFVGAGSLLRWNWTALAVRWRGYRDGMLGCKGFPFKNNPGSDRNVLR
jgi:GT2 family glycosyltransferase